MTMTLTGGSSLRSAAGQSERLPAPVKDAGGVIDVEELVLFGGHLLEQLLGLLMASRELAPHGFRDSLGVRASTGGPRFPR